MRDDNQFKIGIGVLIIQIITNRICNKSFLLFILYD